MEQQIQQDLKQIQQDQWNVQQKSHQMQTHPWRETADKSDKPPHKNNQ